MAVTPVVGAGYIPAVQSIAAQVNAGAGVPVATKTVNGTVKQAALVPAAAVPFADLTAAANAYNALRTALINAGIMSAT